MRTLSMILLASVTAFGQGEVPKGPTQGPPPRNLTKQADGHLSANTEPANVSDYEVHVVLAGETLSGIAAESLKDMKLWPQLWEQNSHIVNPHWIYPSDKILIRKVTKIADATPPAAAPAAAPAPETPAVQPSRTRLIPATAPPPPPAPKSSINLALPRNFSQVKASDLYCSGFIRAAAVAPDLKVSSVKDSENAVLAGEGNYVYLSKGTKDGVKTGTTYQVIRPSRKVDSPKRGLTDRELGTHYLEIAQLQVIQGQDNTSLARVAETCEPIEVGDLVVPYTRTSFPALPSRRPFSSTMKGSGQGQGSIVMALNVLLNSSSAFKRSSRLAGAGSGDLAVLERGIAGEGSVVYVDVGKSENVRPGDLFLVFRDVEETVDGRKEKRRSAIGELVILKVEERASTALVTYSTDAISLGDAVEHR